MTTKDTTRKLSRLFSGAGDLSSCDPPLNGSAMKMALRIYDLLRTIISRMNKKGSWTQRKGIKLEEEVQHMWPVTSQYFTELHPTRQWPRESPQMSVCLEAKVGQSLTVRCHPERQINLLTSIVRSLSASRYGEGIPIKLTGNKNQILNVGWKIIVSLENCQEM